MTNQIRPHKGTLLLIGVDSLGGEVDSALPAALAIELINGFCQVHDDVESGRPSSQGRESLWWVWGPAQAINAGDGLHALARITVLGLIDKGVSLEKTYRAVSLLDEACLKACEGRFRDLEILLKNNPEVGQQSEAVKFLINEYLSSADIKSACEKINFISKDIQNDYLDKFTIYCLINNDRKEEAQLFFDISN